MKKRIAGLGIAIAAMGPGRDAFKAESRVVILRVRDSQVVEYWSLADEPALGRQLGLRAGSATQPPASAN